MQSMSRPTVLIALDPKLVWPSSQAWITSAFGGYLMKFRQISKWLNMMIGVKNTPEDEDQPHNSTEK